MSKYEIIDRGRKIHLSHIDRWWEFLAELKRKGEDSGKNYLTEYFPFLEDRPSYFAEHMIHSFMNILIIIEEPIFTNGMNRLFNELEEWRNENVMD